MKEKYDHRLLLKHLPSDFKQFMEHLQVGFRVLARSNIRHKKLLSLVLPTYQTGHPLFLEYLSISHLRTTLTLLIP